MESEAPHEIKPDPIVSYNVKINNNIGRYALSKNICRFELPIDMKLFESIIFLNIYFNF